MLWLLYLLVEEAVWADALFSDGEEVVHVIHHLSVCHVDPVLDQDLVFLSIKLKDLGILLGNG